MIPFEQGESLSRPLRNRYLQAVSPEDVRFVQAWDEATPNALNIAILGKFEQIHLINCQLTEGFRFFCPFRRGPGAAVVSENN
jgi:hypothetical protein